MKMETKLGKYFPCSTKVKYIIECTTESDQTHHATKDTPSNEPHGLISR